MNKTTRTVVIIAVVLIIIGIIMCAIALFCGGGGLLNRVGLYLRLGPLDYQQQEYSFAIQDIERLEVITVADDVSLHVNTDSDEIKITCVDSQSYDYDVAVSGNTLLVEYQQRVAVNSIWQQHVDGEMQVDIWLPEAFLQEGDISLSLISGDAVIDNLQGATLSVESISGGIEFYRCAFSTMRLDSVSGDIEGTILGNYADYRIEYDTISGDVELNGAEGSASATREIWLNTVSGDIDLNFIQSFTEAMNRLDEAA